MGRYLNGNKDYEQSFYNNAWNTPGIIKRDLADDRSWVDEPRANITMAIHIYTVMTNLAGTIKFIKIMPLTNN
jgi:hypothetical protein